MPTFAYKAKKGPTDIIEGVIEADSIDSVVDRLTLEGYIPVKIQEGTSIKKDVVIKTSSRKVKFKDINIFTNQLANLLKAKVVLIKAIDLIYDQTENVNFKKIVKELADEVRAGGKLSDVLQRYPRYFSTFYVNTVKSGEVGSVLEDCLQRLSEFSHKDEEFRTKIKVAVAYPIFMLIAGVVTVIALLTAVIPKLAAMYDDTGQELPVPTQIVMALSDFLGNYWYIPAASIFICFILYKKRGLTNREKYVFDKIKLKIPAIGNFLKEAEVARFSRTVSLLLDNGVSLHEAIEASVPTLSNLVIREDLDTVGKDVIGGLSFSESLSKSKSFPAFVISMITVGEEGGSLNESLNDVADYYEREGDQAMKIISALIEPAMILVMGIIIGFIVIAMLLPIFDINVSGS